MKSKHSISRRKLLVSTGQSILLAPLCYPLAASAKISSAGSKADPSAAASKKTANHFLVRDFRQDKLELIRLLKEITEVEHSLMLQYLYAGFSLKPAFSALAGSGVPDSQSFIGVAVQEMQHLGAVNRLLVELGASPSMDIQDFPIETDIYPFAQELEPLSRKSVAKYAYCEGSPDDISDRSPENRAFSDEITNILDGAKGINHVGSVYAILLDLMGQVRRSDSSLRIDFDYWHETLEAIMVEGEDDHFNFFKSVFMGTHPVFGSVGKAQTDWWNLPPDSAQYPAYQMPVNPSAYSGHPRHIKDPVSAKMAWLSNLHYWSVLIALDLYYRTGDESLRGLALGQMMAPLRVLGGELAKRGSGLPFDQLSLGYSPSNRLTDNLGFAIQLQQEAGVVRAELGAELPAEYPATIESSFITQLQRIAGQWQKTTPQPQISSLFSGSFS